MKQTLRTKTLSITIEQSFDAVFDYLTSEENLPLWNRGFCRSLRKQQARWILESPLGTAPFHFSRDDRNGVIDQVMEFEEREPFIVPMRVLPNGDGTEVVMTVFQSPGLDEREYHKLLNRADQGLRDLKRALEQPPTQNDAPVIAPTPAVVEEEPVDGVIPVDPSGALPVDTPVSTTRLYVGNLPYDWTDDRLREHFAAVAPVKIAEIARMGRGRSRGFGFVEMENEPDAQKAIEQLHGSTAGSRRISVRQSKPKTQEPKHEPRADPRGSRRQASGGRAREPERSRSRRAPSHHHRPRRVEESAHVDQDEPVVETGGYYFVPRRPRNGETETAEEMSETPNLPESPPPSRRRSRRH